MKINTLRYNSFILAFYLNSFFFVIILKLLRIPIPITIFHLFLLSFTFFKEKYSKSCLITIFFFILIAFNILCNLNITISFRLLYFKLIITSIISVLYINLKVSLNLIKKYLKYFSTINVIFLIYLIKNKYLYSLLGFSYMSWGYTCLSITLFFIYFYQETLKYRDLIISLFTLFLLFLFGSRFGLILGIIGIIFMLYQSKNKIFKLFILFGTISSIFAIINIKTILVKTINLLKIYNLPIKSINRLIFTINDFLAGKDISSGRSIIYQDTLQIIKENFLFGAGFFGYIGKVNFSSPNGMFYPHNIFLEILMHFGIIGLIVFFIIIFINIKKIYFERKKGYKIDNIYFVFIVLSLELLLSNSYLFQRWFWFALLIPFNKSYYNKIPKKIIKK